MKKICILLILINALLPWGLKAESEDPAARAPGNTVIVRNNETADLSWKNPENNTFSKVILFRSTIPIEAYFSYEAVEGLCDKIYQGQNESYIDTGLAPNLPYYYIIFSADNSGKHSQAVLFEKEGGKKSEEPKNNGASSLGGVDSETVNRISLNEAGIVYNYNQPVDFGPNSDSQRLALFIIVKSPHDLNEADKNSISYFIHSGTQTTIILGSGERAGVLNSYLSVFDKLPRSELEWSDVIKIANGRWPDERNEEAEEKAANSFFSLIYERRPNMDDPFDSAAVTVIAYGLRPAQRNLGAEKSAIKIYRSIFGHDPVEAADWDLVRAIAYSGAVR